MVTGAFGALGSAVAGLLKNQGAALVLVDATPVAPPVLADAFADHLLLPGVDLVQPRAAEAAIREVELRFGCLDGLVNVAGAFRWETVAEGSPDTWDLMYALNIKTALHMCRSALPLLKRSGAGRIVNIGAGAGGKAGLGMGAYAASKAGLMRLTEALSEELKDDGITVNAILPSIIDTPANRKDMPKANFSRWVRPESIASAIAFLLAPEAHDITGSAIAINGRV
ncbi:SDR family NAD(P)-dependent oxidoreductase [Noviherbaspirillum sedimenti]|uniref:SDR family oxidoreductase n=1 Tax=Noviherbaspirillum sedimenti TaxID=2320865 RepID=A0A3A3FWU7_9BURK|nr:SDR family NAD(P)-dependent oxidoreductase [Noviherbaspirillum sedimenti]RJG00617.1 SDR family oxidoreductase [Noviherbaspirillum sedimenti]